jgi:CubicO group peptidase (beta-lactamase class C family)
VSARWIDSATAAHASLNTDDDYGFGWWRRRYDIAGRSIDVTYASGNGAQLAIAAPVLDLVIVVNAGNYNYAHVRRDILDTLVPALLAAAIPD